MKYTMICKSIANSPNGQVEGLDFGICVFVPENLQSFLYNVRVLSGNVILFPWVSLKVKKLYFPIPFSHVFH